MKSLILKYAPVSVQNLAITLFNTYQYRIRHGGAYRRYRAYFAQADRMTGDQLRAEGGRRLDEFLTHASGRSTWYAPHRGKPLSDYPILGKDDIVKHLDLIRTVPERDGLASFTGGTTGASLKVVYRREDIQERFATLDHFRAKFGYRLGRRTAWFSGKSLVRERDLARGLCYRDDYVSKIRFFSTFHISETHFLGYWNALCEFKPEFLVGFPSSVYDICVMAAERGLKMTDLPAVFFPTAEPVLPHQEEVIREVLGCRIVEQYASSEGAPFILECESGQLHIHPLTGVFEVVDESLNPAIEGEILVTSFSTRGTPLVRYRIGDRIRLAAEHDRCECGSEFPLVEKIFGRETDFVLSPENGRVNLGNLSNCTKGIAGIACFQIIQCDLRSITVNIVSASTFGPKEKEAFLAALRERVGSTMRIELRLVDQLEREASGKFRFVKNLLPSTAPRVPGKGKE
jgi:phenylacetate-CoA ligase